MTVYRLYVFLLDIAPPIWRRVELSSETSLAQLHKVLQSAMGWQDYHLHEFGIGGQRYGVPPTGRHFYAPLPFRHAPVTLSNL
jgi:hypothetical protein